jgi:O-antigen/teichoic acid export membrane protein
MLVGRSAVYLLANIFSAVLGLVNVVVFTRWFAPSEYGIYVIGAAFAAITSTLLSTWLRLPIARDQAREDGTDIRAYVVVGFVLSCVVAPVTFVFAGFVGLPRHAAIVATLFALAISYYETLQDLLRVRLQTFTVMKATMIRAALVPALGIASSMLGTSGIVLLASSAIAYAVAALACTSTVWRGVSREFVWSRLWGLAFSGIPLTLALTLLAVSGWIDRFVISLVFGSAQSGEYSAGVDLIRQTLIIPAISLAGVFFPLAVKIFAKQGADAVHRHLEESLELLAAVTLPAAVGLAAISPHLANLVLGAEFRSMAATTMPIVAVAAVFQIFTYQYLHVSFLLSNRNSYYLINAACTVTANVVIATLMIAWLGPIGAAWARLVADLLGCVAAALLTRRAVPIPLTFGRLPFVILATVAMALTVKLLDPLIGGGDAVVLAVTIPAGALIYSAICLAANVAHGRDHLHGAIAALRSARSRSGRRSLPSASRLRAFRQ